jgi:hypothetical protein
VWVTKVRGAAIDVTSYARDFWLLNNFVSNSAFSAFNINGDDAQRGIVAYNTVEDVGAHGYEGVGKDILITGNVFDTFGGWGVLIGGSVAGVPVTHVDVTYNIIKNGSNISAGGIQIFDEWTGVNVSHNTVFNVKNLGIFVVSSGSPAGQRGTVIGNVVYDTASNSATGMGIESPNLLVTGNTVFDSRSGGSRTQARGIDVKSPSDASTIIADNYAFNNTASDIRRVTAGAGTLG